MKILHARFSDLFLRTLTGALLLAAWLSPAYAEYTSGDGSLTARGFVQAEAFTRKDVDLTKGAITGQLELNKAWQPRGLFSEISLHGTFRASYDSAYDINDDEWGKKAGGPIAYEAPANPALFAFINGGASPFDPTTNPDYAGVFGPDFTPANGAIPLPGTGGTINSPNNPNDGLRRAAGDVYNYQDGGIILATPVRPCDVDNRGCLKDYMDKDLDELRFREFNDDLDFIRELYLDTAVPLIQGKHEIAMRLGRQQVVWGRTDLFRVLDVVNPMDFSIQNLYTEFEDQRIPQGILNLEYRFGATGWFEDMNIQALWKFEDARPHTLGQGGEPYAILGAGNLFRALGNCWQNGCTVGNFPATGMVVDFPANSIGIRDVNLPSGDDIGARVEGVFKGVGFSLNALYYYSQFPSLRGVVDNAVNPFVCQAGQPCAPGAPPPPNPIGFYPYNIAFDVEFPRLMMYGGSADWYSEWAKTSFRVEMSYTQDEEFANTLREELFSESDVFRGVFGFDRPTFIPWLNRTRSFLISAQIFYQRLLDYESANVNVVQAPGQEPFQTIAPVGIQDWEDNILLTLLFQGNYMNDRLTPQLLTAYDTEAKAGVAGISLEYKPSNNWVWRVAFNLKWSDDADEWKADDDRTANVFPPFTCNPALLPPATVPPDARCFAPYSSVGLQGFEPLGRFRAGPIGTAHNEDEFQLTLRYQF
jgi:hypothetical protein